MRRLVFIFIIALFCEQLYGQESTEKLKIHSVSIALNLYVANNLGLNGSADVTFRLSKKLFKTAVAAGGEIPTCAIGPCRSDSFSSYDLLYGREFRTSNLLSFDVFAGIGYFRYKSPLPSSQDYLTEETVGVPLQTRVRIMISQKLDMGIQLHGNLNSAQNLFSFGPFFQWNLE